MRILDKLREDLKKAYKADVITLDDYTEYIQWLASLDIAAGNVTGV